jgi:hypothetical protein
MLVRRLRRPLRDDCSCRRLEFAQFGFRAVRLSAQFGCPRISAVRAFRLSAQFAFSRRSLIDLVMIQRLVHLYIGL